MRFNAIAPVLTQDVAAVPASGENLDRFESRARAANRAASEACFFQPTAPRACLNEKPTGKPYRLQPHDTLGELSRRFRCEPARLLAMNGLTGPDDLRSGAVMRVPGLESDENDPRPMPDPEAKAALPPRGSWHLPVQGESEITSEFGRRFHPIMMRHCFHPGIDIRAARGTTIHAAAAGTVMYSGYYKGYGRTIILDHGNGLKSRYGHLQHAFFRRGDRIEADRILGIMGASGLATGRHLHFEVRLNNRPVNPELLVDFSNIKRRLAPRDKHQKPTPNTVAARPTES